MTRYLIGFTAGALFTVTMLLWTAPRPVPATAPGWYNPAHILHYT